MSRMSEKHMDEQDAAEPNEQELEIRSMTELEWVRDEMDRMMETHSAAEVFAEFCTLKGLARKLQEFRSKKEKAHGAP
jgi:hypothetical protein